MLEVTSLTPKEIQEGQTYVALDITAAAGMYMASNRWYTFAGKAIMWDETFGDAVTIISYGKGFSYHIARAFGVRAGVDVDWSPDSFGWFIVFGHNWNR